MERLSWRFLFRLWEGLLEPVQKSRALASLLTLHIPFLSSIFTTPLTLSWVINYDRRLAPRRWKTSRWIGQSLLRGVLYSSQLYCTYVRLITLGMKEGRRDWKKISYHGLCDRDEMGSHYLEEWTMVEGSIFWYGSATQARLF